MKQYIATDALNPNAVNARYGRPASDCGVQAPAVRFEAADDAAALVEFDRLIEDGYVGYSEYNTGRSSPMLWRSKEWHGARKRSVWPTPA